MPGLPDNTSKYSSISEGVILLANPYSTIESQYALEFAKTVHVLAQEKESKLLPFVKVIDFSGEAYGYDRFGTVQVQEVVERFQPIQLADAAWDRRWMNPRWFAVPVGIDEKDVEKMMRNPGQELAEACAFALNRERDAIIYQAAYSAVNTGKSYASTTSVTAANDGVTTIDATGGFGFATLQTIKQNFVDAAVATDVDTNIALTVDGKRLANLMGEIELTSFDYATEKPLATGTMGQAYGIKLIPFASNPGSGYTPLLQVGAVTSSDRTLVALAENSIVFAKGITKIRIEKRIDMLNTPTQIIAEMAIAAVRTEGCRVQLVTVPS